MNLVLGSAGLGQLGPALHVFRVHLSSDLWIREQEEAMFQGSLVRALRVTCEDVVCVCAQHVHAFVCVYMCVWFRKVLP